MYAGTEIRILIKYIFLYNNKKRKMRNLKMIDLVYNLCIQAQKDNDNFEK